MTEAFGEWLPDRPNTLVIACSDGRLQEATDEFLAHHLQVALYRCEVDSHGVIRFADLAGDARSRLHSSAS